jgi:hypothetical protein
MFLLVDYDELIDFVSLGGLDPENAFHGLEFEDDSVGMHFHRLNILVGDSFYEVFFFYGE